MTENLQARLILEILGRPASNVTEALTGMVERIGKEKGVNILEKNIHEPVKVKDVEDLFTSFVELLIECDTLSTFFGVVFAYMPSNIELISPENFVLRNEEVSSITNKILTRLHNYDAIARRLLVDNSLLKQKLGISDLSPQAQSKMQEATKPQEEKTEKVQEVKKVKKSKKQKKKK